VRFAFVREHRVLRLRPDLLQAMAVLRRCMVVFKARCGCLLGRSQSGLVKSSNASSLVAMVGVPVGRSRLKIAAPLPSFGSGRRSVKNLSTTTTTTTTVVVGAGELEDSIYNINFDYLTQDMPMTTALPSNMPGGSMPYEPKIPSPSYDS
jgi:hypothetical protein